MKNDLKIERAKKDITQATLAENIGVSRQTINAIEIGKFISSTLLALKWLVISKRLSVIFLNWKKVNNYT